MADFFVAVFARVQTFVELSDHRGELLEAGRISFIAVQSSVTSEVARRMYP